MTSKSRRYCSNACKAQHFSVSDATLSLQISPMVRILNKDSGWLIWFSEQSAFAKQNEM
ncbi:hypothetical protein BN873_980113 [Candidatus Competibacter denitrificans Run_A_D11]|uniref:Uncharacterized protein n=1 Tax=Candidatus Competibacter denitrificans Run_A_D11 TaxID=1400863 RepID=W6MA05_9GAMM|nr:hypothetical protein BN873_980113 [Candidatus Competibacter denitrificans Run_A_D11]